MDLFTSATALSTLAIYEATIRLIGWLSKDVAAVVKVEEGAVSCSLQVLSGKTGLVKSNSRLIASVVSVVAARWIYLTVARLMAQRPPSPTDRSEFQYARDAILIACPRLGDRSALRRFFR